MLDCIVGTWLVTYGGPLAAQAFIQWHSDGTQWENIDLPTLGGNICMGDGRVVDENHVRRSHVGWLFSDGNPAGYFTQTETAEVAKDGSWYRGTNYIRMLPKARAPRRPRASRAREGSVETKRAGLKPRPTTGTRA